MKQVNGHHQCIGYCKLCFEACFYFSEACSIELYEKVIITGRYLDNTRVDVYSLIGWIMELPKLNEGRHGHGCGHYWNSDGMMVNCIS